MRHIFHDIHFLIGRVHLIKILLRKFPVCLIVFVTVDINIRHLIIVSARKRKRQKLLRSVKCQINAELPSEICYPIQY